MSTDNILPNGDITTQWSVFGSATYHYERIDEITPVLTDGLLARGTANANDIEQFNFATTDIGGEIVTQIEVKIYHDSNWYIGSGNIGYVDLYIGDWQAQKTLSEPWTSTWETFTWSGLSASQSDLDGMQVKITAGNLQQSTNCVTVYDQIIVYSMYAIVTYEIGKWPHKIQGVVSVNIGKINGVPIEQIGKINGVA